MQVPTQDMPVEMADEYQEDEYQEDDTYASKKKDVSESPESFYFDNLAEGMKDADLLRISNEVIEGFKTDEDSISELKEMRIRYNKLFDLTHEDKNFPWDGAASVKLPNLTKACIQFASRAGINSEVGDEIAKIDPVSNDEESFYRAKNVSAHFNHQLKYGKPNHYLSHRKTRIQLARDGYAFRKVYWDSFKKEVVSEHILPEDFVVNYWSRSLESCYRYTHVLKLNENQIKVKMAQGIYRDVDIDGTESKIDTETETSRQNMGQTAPEEDFTTVRDVLECHTYIYIKENDDLRVPVIVTVDRDSEQVLRIVRRSHPETGQEMTYFSSYTFIPNDKSIFGYGFGHLLYNIVATMNACTNQMINAGTLNTTSTGLVSKHSGLKGQKTMKMGEFIELEGRVEDIKKNIFQMQFPAPSSVLLSLLQYLGEQTDQLSTITEIMTGVQKSDTTAEGSRIAQSESVKLFTDIQKAYHLSLGEEFQCMKMMYSIFLDESQTVDIQGMTPFQITRRDYKTSITIFPVADPNVLNKEQQVQKAEFVLTLIKQDPFLQQDPRALLLGTTNLLEAIGVNPKKIAAIEAIYAESVQNAQNQMAANQQAAQQQQLQQDVSNMEQQQQENLEKDLAEVEKNEKQKGGENA